MAKIRIKVCWLLLLVLVGLSGMVMSIGTSEARYLDTVVWNTKVDTPLTGVFSNYLVGENETPLTVLVGELPLDRSTQVSFWLESVGADATGKLSWGFADQDHDQYLDVYMRSGPETMEVDADIELIDDIRMDMTMILMPTELARTEAHEELKINVLVTWGDTMWGTFQVIIPAVEMPEEEEIEEEETEPDAGPENNEEENVPGPEDQTEPENGEIENELPTDGNETSDPSEGREENAGDDVNPAPEENDDPQAQEPGSDAPEDATEEPSEDPEEVAADDTSEDPEYVGEDDVSDDPEEENAEPEVPSENPDTEGEPEVPEDEEEELPEDLIQITTIGDAVLRYQLPVVIDTLEPVTSIRLGLKEQETETETETEPETETVTETENESEVETVVETEAETEMETEAEPETEPIVVIPFPENTRISLNQGESYYIMYNGYIPEFNLQELSSLSVLIDFGQTALEEGEELILVAEAYAEEELLDVCEVATVVSAGESCQMLPVSVLEEEVSEVSLAEEEGDVETCVMNRENFLIFTFPLSWKDAVLEYTVEFLSMSEEEQTLVYSPVTTSAEALSAEYTNTEDAHTLMLKIGESLPNAGTYRVNMKWSFKEICFAQTQMTFFINYSDYTSYNLSGQEVPNND